MAEMTRERREYLLGLADDYGVAEDVVFMLADLLGPNEDRDGLLTSREDAAGSDMFKE